MAARIEAGDLHAGMGSFDEAIESYSSAAAGGCEGAEPADEHARAACRYRALAKGKLETLRQQRKYLRVRAR